MCYNVTPDKCCSVSWHNITPLEACILAQTGTTRYLNILMLDRLQLRKTKVHSVCSCHIHAIFELLLLSAFDSKIHLSIKAAQTHSLFCSIITQRCRKKWKNMDTSCCACHFKSFVFDEYNSMLSVDSATVQSYSTTALSCQVKWILFTL